ncbi:hypothetical protein Pelo_13052 [Pelomyxa schiedti]|nr:hypothetical protein Pelo_13052 [Pelomyxa schiedti]
MDGGPPRSTTGPRAVLGLVAREQLLALAAITHPRCGPPSSSLLRLQGCSHAALLCIRDWLSQCSSPYSCEEGGPSSPRPRLSSCLVAHSFTAEVAGGRGAAACAWMQSRVFCVSDLLCDVWFGVSPQLGGLTTSVRHWPRPARVLPDEETSYKWCLYHRNALGSTLFIVDLLYHPSGSSGGSAGGDSSQISASPLEAVTVGVPYPPGNAYSSSFGNPANPDEALVVSRQGDECTVLAIDVAESYSTRKLCVLSTTSFDTKFSVLRVIVVRKRTGKRQFIIYASEWEVEESFYYTYQSSLGCHILSVAESFGGPVRRIASKSGGEAKIPLSQLSESLFCLCMNWMDRGSNNNGSGPELVIRLQPIGYVHTDFVESRFRTREDLESQEATISFLDQYADALQGVDAYATCLVVFYLHGLHGQPPLLTAHPRGDLSRPARGVWTTGSPMRPNHLAITKVHILSVEGCVMRVRGLDALDGTPVVDIHVVDKKGGGVVE